MMIAMELHMPLANILLPNFTANMAVLDLRVLNYGVPGYCWVFPTVSDGEPIVSLGLMAAPFVAGESSQIKGVFGSWLSGFGLDLRNFELSSHPALRYESKAQCSQPRVLFVGDAAGVEPLFGEGIVSALAYGRLAALSAFEALRDGDLSFSKYEKRVRSSAIGSMMRRRRMIARRLYARPKLARLFLKHGALIKGLALLHVHKYGGQITWEAGGNKGFN
jgi:flavin-dependent dehydrogenase